MHLGSVITIRRWHENHMQMEMHRIIAMTYGQWQPFPCESMHFSFQK